MYSTSVPYGLSCGCVFWVGADWGSYQPDPAEWQWDVWEGGAGPVGPRLCPEGLFGLWPLPVCLGVWCLSGLYGDPPGWFGLDPTDSCCDPCCCCLYPSSTGCRWAGSTSLWRSVTQLTLFVLLASLPLCSVPPMLSPHVLSPVPIPNEASITGCAC